MAKREKLWERHRYTCAALACKARAPGYHCPLDKAAFFQLPLGWFFAPTSAGVGFFCSPACSKVVLRDAAAQHAWRVRCEHCSSVGVATRIDGARREAVIAPPANWCGFVFAKVKDDPVQAIHLACSRECLRHHVLALFAALPPAPLRLV